MVKSCELRCMITQVVSASNCLHQKPAASQRKPTTHVTVTARHFLSRSLAHHAVYHTCNTPLTPAIRLSRQHMLCNHC
jgi:hypothetical protein